MPAAKDARGTAVREWMGHIRALAVGIGPRGATRDGERRGAGYAEKVMRRAGLEPRWESFRSARSIFLPHLMGALLVLAAFAVFPVHRPVTAAAAAAVTLLAIASQLLELAFRGNLFRLLAPKAESQNVWASVAPRGAHRRDLVLVGHVDTQRTPFFFRTHAWVKAYDRFTTVAFAAFAWQAVLSLLALFLPLPWAWPALVPSAAAAALLAAMCIQADCTPFTAGANDNASAVGMVLTLGARLKVNPLQHTRVFVVVTGCEEVAHYGMIDFYRRHRPEMKDPRAVVFEMLGCAGPAWSTREGIIVGFRADPRLLATAEKLAAAHPEWGAYATSISGGNTELTDAVRFGVPAIALAGKTRSGVVPYWHQGQDTFDKMDPGVMQRTWDFTRALLDEVDRGAPARGRAAATARSGPGSGVRRQRASSSRAPRR
jgi:hypothetical protein